MKPEEHSAYLTAPNSKIKLANHGNAVYTGAPVCSIAVIDAESDLGYTMRNDTRKETHPGRGRRHVLTNGHTPDPRYLKQLILQTLANKKAIDPIAIDLAGKSDIADYMVISSGTSTTHIRALAEHIVEALRGYGIWPIATEGMSSGEWVIIDTPYIVSHIFKPNVRAQYNLEKMWQAELAQDVPLVELGC